MSDTEIFDNWATKIPKDYRNSVIEECARVAELWWNDYNQSAAGYTTGVAAAIRALKEKP